MVNFISAGVALTAVTAAGVALAAVVVARAARRAHAANPVRTALLLSVALALWLAVTAGLARSGVLADPTARPPRVPLLPLAALSAFALAGSTRLFGRLLVAIPPWLPVAAQTFRLVVEYALWRLYREGSAPVQVTLEGWNWDALAGLTAPAMALGMAAGRVGPRGAIAWNSFGLATLGSAVFAVVTSAPGPLRLDWPGEPFTAVATWPTVWIPALLAPTAVFLHVASIRQSLARISASRLAAPATTRREYDMTRPKILVTGAAGKTGAAVAAQLLAEGWPVRAVVRRRDDRSERLARLGAEAVVADLFDPEQMFGALEGTDRAYYVPPMHPHMLHSAVAFADAARAAGVGHIVQMSQWTSSPSHPAALTRQTWLVDRLFANLPGVGHTIVNPGMFADNFLRVIDMAAHLGVYPVITGTSRCAPVSNEDIARVVVAVLKDPGRHGGKRYRPTGPRLLTGGEMAAEIGSVLGRRVRPVAIPFWMFCRVARMQRADPFEISGYRYYLRDQRAGAFELDGGVTGTVLELTGSPAESFEATARRYAAQPFARRTVANTLRAAANFLRVPFQPGYNLDRYEREHSFPVPCEPRLTMDSDTWLREHRRAILSAAA